MDWRVRFNAWLEQLVPHQRVAGYQHNRAGEDNADAHLKRQVMGHDVVVAVTEGITRQGQRVAILAPARGVVNVKFL